MSDSSCKLQNLIEVSLQKLNRSFTGQEKLGAQSYRVPVVHQK